LEVWGRDLNTKGASERLFLSLDKGNMGKAPINDLRKGPIKHLEQGC